MFSLLNDMWTDLLSSARDLFYDRSLYEKAASGEVSWDKALREGARTDDGYNMEDVRDRCREALRQAEKAGERRNVLKAITKQRDVLKGCIEDILEHTQP